VRRFVFGLKGDAHGPNFCPAGFVTPRSGPVGMMTIGEWLFEPRARRLIAGQDERRLSVKAASLLEALAESPGQIWSRDALLERVWPRVTVGEESLTHAIAELRGALGDDFRKPRFIETVYKSGYRLKSAVELVSPAGPARPAAETDFGNHLTYVRACDLFDQEGARNTEAAAALLAEKIATEPDLILAGVGRAKAFALVVVYYRPTSADLESARLPTDPDRRDPRLDRCHCGNVTDRRSLSSRS
jgi:DNA-binding winged helix-turn-helix (wHTH) protein